MHRKSKIFVVLLAVIFVCHFVPFGYSTDAADLAWEKTYCGWSWDSGGSVQVTGDGGYIISGETRSSGTGSADVYLMKVDPQGRARQFCLYSRFLH